MSATTAALWAQQDRHRGDRLRLFAAVADAVDVESVLYPGSYVDLAPSFVFPDVTYVDVDRRAARFFDDDEGVRTIVGSHRDDPQAVAIRFIHADYRRPLDVPDESVDLVVSLYAGFVSEHCTRYLQVGGVLLVNPSHGDAAIVSLDGRYALEGAVQHRSGRYRVTSDDLDSYLTPKRPDEVTMERIHATGRGIAYTKPAFAYLFRRVR